MNEGTYLEIRNRWKERVFAWLCSEGREVAEDTPICWGWVAREIAKATLDEGYIPTVQETVLLAQSLVAAHEQFREFTDLVLGEQS